MPDPKLTVRLSPEVHERLKQRADLEHRSVHGQILVYIERGLEQDEAEGGSEAEAIVPGPVARRRAGARPSREAELSAASLARERQQDAREDRAMGGSEEAER